MMYMCTCTFKHSFLHEPVLNSNSNSSTIPGGKPILSYQGIPFALPPEGDLRFALPVPAPKWDGVLRAEKQYRCSQVGDNVFPQMIMPFLQILIRIARSTSSSTSTRDRRTVCTSMCTCLETR